MTLIAPSNTLAGEVPLPFDLRWVQGDTVAFSLYFKGVNWVEVDPGVTNQPTWVGKTWQAQVRDPYWHMIRRFDMWVPVYGYQPQWYQTQSGIAMFAMAAQLVNVMAPTPASETVWVVDTVLRTTTFIDVGTTIPAGFYTKVRILLPSSLSVFVRPAWWYRWDLQTTSLDVDPVRKTYLRGRIRVLSQSTML